MKKMLCYNSCMRHGGYFTSRGLSKLVLWLGVLTFFMPFLTVSCGTNEFITPTGIDAITSKTFAVLDTTSIFSSYISIIICLVSLVFLLIILYIKQKRFSLLLWGLSLVASTLSILWFSLTTPQKIFQIALNYVGYNIKDVLSVNIGIGLWTLIAIIIVLDIVYLKRLMFEPLVEEENKKYIFARSFRLGNPFELETEYYLL